MIITNLRVLLAHKMRKLVLTAHEIWRFTLLIFNILSLRPVKTFHSDPSQSFCAAKIGDP